ncbi:NAD(P)/FAD-dependent oxidoreductase, partial [Escherichia coli]|nr:NAD(P)/FAD-dependent oxidoreductase [Escherichia coli]
VSWNKLILCCGARELALPFPGWTLPGVSGAGGLQAQMKQGLHMANQKVVIAGSGPLLLAVADTVRRAGGEVVAIVEQAPRAALLRFGF